MKKKRKPKLNIVIYYFSGFLLLLTFLILWITGFIHICGDHYCANKECSLGCSDCSPSSCSDHICQTQIGENCANSDDCYCDTNQVCKIYRDKSNTRGCYDIKCGDNYCDNKLESQKNCCEDCGCQKGYYCNKNQCVFQEPKLDIIDSDILKNISASTLYSNKNLIDNNGTKHAFARFLIENNAPNTAFNILASLKIDGYTLEDNLNIGNLKPHETHEIDWYPTGKSKLLTLNENSNLLIQLTLKYNDENNEEHITKKSFPFSLKGKNSLGVLTSLSQFVTPIDPTVRKAVSLSGAYNTQTEEGIQNAAKAIWNFLSYLNIEYLSDPILEYIQYPAETLKNKKGDCDDLSILYASMLESVGIKTELVIIPNHIFTGYFSGEYFWPVETTMLGSSFEMASEKGKTEYNSNSNKIIIDVFKEQKSKSLKLPSYINVGEVNLNFSNIKVSSNPSAKWICKHHDKDESCDLFELRVYCHLNFINLGNGAGKKCVNAHIFIENNIVKTETICKEVKANSEDTAYSLYKKQEPYSYSVKYTCNFAEI